VVKPLLSAVEQTYDIIPEELSHEGITVTSGMEEMRSPISPRYKITYVATEMYHYVSLS
jgi:hypothetical protein